mmetsp:Transcript_21141/g.49544  ORF Transcript_21141/g.49544 Transcript_21141/m.49544 type:complete len:249 (-) Transcript_21141:930-1676(-)
MLILAFERCDRHRGLSVDCGSEVELERVGVARRVLPVQEHLSDQLLIVLDMRSVGGVSNRPEEERNLLGRRSVVVLFDFVNSVVRIHNCPDFQDAVVSGPERHACADFDQLGLLRAKIAGNGRRTKLAETVAVVTHENDREAESRPIAAVGNNGLHNEIPLPWIREVLVEDRGLDVQVGSGLFMSDDPLRDVILKVLLANRAVRVGDDTNHAAPFASSRRNAEREHHHFRFARGQVAHDVTGLRHTCP